jgi:hypothetical protein
MDIYIHIHIYTYICIYNDNDDDDYYSSRIYNNAVSDKIYLSICRTLSKGFVSGIDGLTTPPVSVPEGKGLWGGGVLILLIFDKTEFEADNTVLFFRIVLSAGPE